MDCRSKGILKIRQCQLIALIGLKPKGVISTRKIGDLLIKQTLSPENQSDILMVYIIAETVFSILDEVGI